MENNYDIFKILNPNGNVILSKLSSSDINSVVTNLDKYYLELRDNIGNYPNDTAGFEFEFEDYDETLIRREMSNKGYFKEDYKLYKDGEDSLVSDFLTIGEICTSILNISNINWDRIKDLCYIIKKNGYIGNNCGAHIHIGAQIMNNNMNSLTNFTALIIAYENVLARFFYGNFINERLSMHTYAPLVASAWYDIYLEFESEYFKRLNSKDLINKLSGYFEKNQFINLSNVSYLGEEYVNNTFEYRAPNGTLDPIIWQNNLNLIVKLMKCCNSDKFNLELVENRISKNIMNFNDYKYYRSINIDAALELADLIFDNNIDKIYFLRQYLKDNMYTDEKALVLSRKFTETPYNDNDIV